VGKSKVQRFRGTILEGHKGCAVEVPFDPADRLGTASAPLWRGRRGHRVQGTIRGIRFETAIVSRSKRFWMLVGDEQLEAARLRAGDRVAVAVEPLPRTR
jgi:hypothetical protein